MNIPEKISEKIENIRRKPERMRMRYVWGSVAVSMFFIIAIWIFSMSSLFQGDNQSASTSEEGSASITEQLGELKKQAPSMKNFSEDIIDINESTSDLSETINQ